MNDEIIKTADMGRDPCAMVWRMWKNWYHFYMWWKAIREQINELIEKRAFIVVCFIMWQYLVAFNNGFLWARDFNFYFYHLTWNFKFQWRSKFHCTLKFGVYFILFHTKISDRCYNLSDFLQNIWFRCMENRPLES